MRTNVKVGMMGSATISSSLLVLSLYFSQAAGFNSDSYKKIGKLTGVKVRQVYNAITKDNTSSYIPLGIYAKSRGITNLVQNQNVELAKQKSECDKLDTIRSKICLSNFDKADQDLRSFQNKLKIANLLERNKSNIYSSVLIYVEQVNYQIIPKLIEKAPKNSMEIQELSQIHENIVKLAALALAKLKKNKKEFEDLKMYLGQGIADD